MNPSNAEKKNVTEDQRKLADLIDEALESNASAGDGNRPAKIRERISDEMGIDLDKALRKELGRRTAREQAAVDRYARELFPEPEQYEPSAEEAEADRIYEESRQLYGRYEQGEPEAQSEFDAILLRMLEAYQLAEKAFGAELEYYKYIEQMKESPWTLLNDPDLTPERHDAVLYYINANVALKGVLDASNESSQDKRDKISEEIQRRTHKGRGVIVPATMKVDGRPTYIIKGDVAMFADGSGVDVQNSSNAIIILDEHGEYKFISPDQIMSVGETIDPQIELRIAYEAIDREQQEGLLKSMLQQLQPLTYYINGSAQERFVQNAKRNLAERKEREMYDEGYEAAINEIERLSTVALSRNIARLRGKGIETLNSYERGYLDAIEYEVQGRRDYEEQELERLIREEETAQRNARETERREEEEFLEGYSSGVNDKELASLGIEGLEKEIRHLEDSHNDNSYLYGRLLGMKEMLRQIKEKKQRVSEAEKIEEKKRLDKSLKEWKRKFWETNRTESVSEPAEVPNLFDRVKKIRTALDRVPVDKETGEPILTHESVDAETAWDAAVEFFGSAEDALSYIQSEANKAKTAITAAEKGVTRVKPSGGMKKYRDDLAVARAKVDENKAVLVQWEAIAEVQKRRKSEENTRRAAERTKEMAKLHDEARVRFEEQQRVRAEKQAEQDAIGAHAINPKISEKWEAAPKVDGHPDIIILPDGSSLSGHYVMTEAMAASASHDPDNAFEPTEGFPIDVNGQSVNDRDYKRDKDAQRIVENMADAYDSRAMQTPVIVSKDGIVLSGNNRTMSGDLAAKQGTDTAYNDYLRRFGRKYGFTPEQVGGFKNPRVVFVPDEPLPYDANTFARFNAQEKKSQSKAEAAVKLGKIVPDNIFTNIVNEISRYERLSAFYSDERAVAQTLGALMSAGVINDKQMPELRTGTTLSASGKELIENTLIGKVFQSTPDAVRQIIAIPILRESIVMGLSEIANNSTLTDRGYGLSEELARAIDLVHRAKVAQPDVFTEGVPVSPFGRMQGLFDDEYGDSRVTDATTLLLADILNSGKPSELRKILAAYNQAGVLSANGQMDMFAGAISTKEEILTTINNHFKNATPKEQQALVEAAIAERKQRAEAEAEQRGGSAPSEQTENALQGDGESSIRAGGNAERMGESSDTLEQEEEIDAPLSEEKDEFGYHFVLSSDKTTTFGHIDPESGLAELPIKLSVGSNYKDENGKNHGYGLRHISAGHKSQILQAGFSSVEEFVESVARNYTAIREGAIIAGNQTYLLEVHDAHNNTLFIQLSRDRKYWNVNSAGIFKKKYSRNKPEVYNRPALGNGKDTDTIGVNSGQNEGATAPAGNSPETSDGKGNALSGEKQTSGRKSSEIPGDRPAAPEPRRSEETPGDRPETPGDKAGEASTTTKDAPAAKKTVKEKGAKRVKPEQAVADLFGGMDDEEQISNEGKKTDVQSRPGTGERERGYEPRQDEPMGTGERNEAERTDGGRVGGRDNVNSMSDGERGVGVSRKSKSAEPLERLPEGERRNIRNNRADRGTDYAPKGEETRIKANIQAIELAQQLLESGENATPEQMAILRKFSGWGGLGRAFNENNPTSRQLRNLLGEKGYEQANMSRNSAYYTPAEVIDTMWDIAKAMGFKGGNVLEGSAGIGNILGLMPAELSDRSNIHAVEIDGTTGGILSLLYPDAKVDIQGFEQTKIINNSVDLAITNVPFVVGLHVMDKTGDKDLSTKFRDIHDFCIAKNIRKLREGGIGIFITSNGTMDNSVRLRAWITNEGNADVVGAFRMHNKTFGGTGATSDIIVVRKRVNGKPSPNAINITDVTGVRTAQYDTGETKKVAGQEIPIIKTLPMEFNKYFAEHPENMAGEMRFGFEEGDTYRPQSKALYPVKEKNQSAMLESWVKQFHNMKPEDEAIGVEDSATQLNEQLGEGVKEGSMILNSQGELCIARMGEAVPIKVNKNKVKGHTKAECFKAYTAIKKALKDVLDYQASNDDNKGLEPLLKELNRAFDSFTHTYGNLHKNTAISFLRNDVDFSSILALETYSEKGDKSGKKVVKVGKTDIFSRRVIETEKEPQPKDIKDGILASLYKIGGVDVDYIADALSKSAEEVRKEIVDSGLGFENPATGNMEVSYQYLSGNVREKLHIAEENNEDGRYDKNVSALQKALPMTIPAHLIEFSLGSSWIDHRLYEDFVAEKTGLKVELTNAGGTWFMKRPWSTFNEKNRAMGVVSKLCNKTIMGDELLEAALTNRTITVSKIERHYDGSTETITDPEATRLCATKIDELRAEFKDWARARMQKDSELSETIERTYNEQFNNYVPLTIPEEFVPKHFGGQVSELHGRPFALRPHQGRAVVKATTQPVLLAHEVGTGKTYTLITTAMEMRRLGTARKPMIVVQNATVGQFVESAKEIYPNAKVLTIEEADRTAEGRRNFYAKIKYNDWDMIVVPQSVFERIPDSEEREMAYVKGIIEEKLKVLEAMREADNDGRSMVVRQAEKELELQEQRLAELTEALETKRNNRDAKREAKIKQNAKVKALEMLDREVDDVENFDDMGIDAILVDEAHEYKHLGFATAMQRGVKGVDPSYSKKSQGVYLKAQAVLEHNNGRNVVFATGTPISNTAAEIWTFMRYLMPADRMKAYGIYYFDDFVRNFGNISQMVEFTTSGKFKENNRFAGYINLPELVRIWSSVADTVLTRDAGGVSDKIPDLDGGKAQDVYLPQTRALRSIMLYVNSQLDRYEKMTGKEKKENSHIPLVMYGIAKAAAVDARLVLTDAPDEKNSKTNATVRSTLEALEKSKDYKGTIAIFADNYQNKVSGFNLYEDIRDKLIAQGVAADEIVIIKSGMTVKRKLEIFEKVNAGEIRVVMGSTFTLGTGVNIQERLYMAIHIDAPNRPMDYTQRNGRILRQGNLHKDMGIPVKVIRFGVEDSLDVTAYQRLKTKGAIADSIMNGSKMMQNSMENRVLEEEEDMFGDMTAQLSGSQYAILKNQAEREVRNLTTKQKSHEADQIYIHNKLPEIMKFVRGAERRIEIETSNLETIGKHWPDGKIKSIKIGKLAFKSISEMEDFIKEQNSKLTKAAEEMKQGRDDNYTSVLTIDIDGMEFIVTSRVKPKVAGVGQLSLEVEREVSYSCPTLNIKDFNPSGQRLKAVLQDIEENIVTGGRPRSMLHNGEVQLARYSEEAKILESRQGAEFPFTKELQEAKKRLTECEEAMKKEMEAKKKKYLELDKSVEAATDVTLSDEDGEDIPTNGDGNKYRLVEDNRLLEQLDSEPLKKGFRYSQWANMGVLPPMTAKKDGKWRVPMIFGAWEQSEEGMRKANGKADLVQGNGRITGDVAYNPYFHIRTSPLNDQFTAAYDRPELIVVEGYYPESEETSGYKADGAKDSVGLMDWHSGSVNGQLSEETKVQTMLSRYFKPNRIVPWSEVAENIMERIGDQKIVFPINAVPPMLRYELAKRGAKFGDISGSVAERDVAMLNDLRDRVNSGEWNAGLEKAREYLDAYESSDEAKETRVVQLSQKLNTPVRIIRTREEANSLPTRRQQRAKGWMSPDGEVVVVLPNNVNVADVENTVVHEVVGHKGLRAFIGEEQFTRFLDEVYDHLSAPIRKIVEAIERKLYDEEVDKILRKKQSSHADINEANENYYKDMTDAHLEADKKREAFKREATEEYMADLGGRIGDKGFEKMAADELTLWGKIKAKVQQFLDKFLRGLKIAKNITLGDKELSYILYKTWKNMRESQLHPKTDIFAKAEDTAMRHKSGYDAESERKLAKEREIERVNEIFNRELEEQKGGKLAEGHIYQLGKPGTVLLSTGVPDLPIQMSARRLREKATEYGHDYDIGELKNLVKELQRPMAVFTYGDKGKMQNIIIGIESNGKQFIVGLSLNPRVNGRLLEINSVRNVFPKNNSEWLNWITQEKLLYADKEKIQALIDKQRTILADVGYLDLEDVAKMVKKFENPKYDEEKMMRFRDPGMGLEETITRMKAEAMRANTDNLQAKRDAMRAIGGNLNHLRSAMARQKEYDITTVKSVTDLAKILMEAGLLDDLSQYETKRILGAVNNVVGKQDVSRYVQKVMDIMVDNQLRNGQQALGKLLTIKGSSVDARGIEVQGILDPDGQRITKVVRRSTSLPKDEIENLMAEAMNRMSSNDQTIADEAAIDYAGLQIAHQYAEEITESKAEEKALRDSIKKAKEDKDAGQMTETAYRQYVESTNDAIRQNKIDRAEAYQSLAERIGDTLSASIERARAWRDAERKRIEEIHHNANSDMEGRPTDEHHKDNRVQKFANNSAVRFLLAPLGTFDQMLRMFGQKNTRGEGYLWNRYMRGWVDATEKEYTGYQATLKVLDKKVSEVFGKDMSWGDLFTIDRRLPKASVKFWDGGEMKEHELTQGNLLYIYMADKMTDGQMKLRRMGITEEDVEEITNFLDPRFMELADWMQEEFLVDKRNEYNEVHKRMFGASMAAIENYFPLKILANARMENVDVADDTTDMTLPATSTGSILKRKRNNVALDVTGANAFSVILDHIQQMERWAAFAEFNRDLNTLLSYKRFKNQVMNISSVYGAGKTLWNNFRNVCSMAAGAYRPPIAVLDKSAVNIAKGVTAAKVSFRVFTALKQILSMPAYISDSNPAYLAANILNPFGAWNWSMKNMPIFEKRWKSRMAGDPRLLKSEMDWKMWRSRVVELASRVGMSPNAFVDALTIAIGSHSIYQTKLAKYKRQGYDAAEAEQRATQDATILFNQTQQSSEGAFLSTMQVDRSWLSVLFTVFRNSSMSYTRQLYDAVRNIGHRLTPGYKGISEEFMAKQMRRDGLDPDKADANAKQEYRRGILRDIARIGVFGFALQMAWNLGAYLPYLLCGEDDDEKSKMWSDIMNHTYFGSVEGLTGGDVMSAAGQMWLNGEGNLKYLAKDMPLAADIISILKKIPNDQAAAMNDVVNLMVQSGVGVNPQSLTDAVVAVIDCCGENVETQRECALLITRILNCPQSQIDKIYFDELGMTGEEASQMTPVEIAERYAEYKLLREAPLMGWARSETTRDSLAQKRKKRVLKTAGAKIENRIATEETRRLLGEYAQTAKREREIGTLKSTDRAAYVRERSALNHDTDMITHMRVKRYKRDMKELTEKYLRTTDRGERDSIVEAMLSTRNTMLNDINNRKE